jgi:CubicO group peptidase (beta-lactamase class C family)
MIELFGTQPFEFEPGTRHGYNNFAYYLLGEIIGRVTGTPFARHVRREMEGMGLARTGVCDEATPGRARSYRRRDGRMTPAPRMSLVILGGAGALCSTTADLVRWTHLLHGGQVVTPASLRAMTERTTLSTGGTEDYGFGVYVEALGGHPKIFHGGGIPWGGYLSHYPEDGLTLVVLTNGAGARDEAAKLEEALARAALGMEVPDLPLTADEMARYAGTYALQAGPRTLEVRVWTEDGRLMAQPAGQPVTRLLSQGDHAFVLEADVDIRLVFTVDGSQATGVTLHQRGMQIPGTRNP